LIDNPTAVVRYQLDNHLGSASLELDENANIISYEEYHPFGTTSYRSGRTETETSQKRYKYVGKERDEETGLYYYGFRYYAAWLCRFISVDPLQFEYPQLTPYNYAGNKPVTHIDIDGLQSSGDEKRNQVKEIGGGQFFNGIQIFHEAQVYGNIPKTHKSIASNSLEIGSYTLVPHYSQMNGKDMISYYTASYTNGDSHDLHYIVGPNQVGKFKKYLNTYSTAASLYYINGVPSEGIIRMAAGETKKGLAMQWDAAIHAPVCVASNLLLIANMSVGLYGRSSTVKPKPKVKPPLKNSSQNAKILRKNLEKAGRSPLKNEDAAHIVASGHPRHQIARDIIEDAGIGVNDAINGLGLPSNTKVPNPLGKITHNVTHRYKTMDKVTKMLQKAEKEGTIKETLALIRKMWESGKF
jgi:RHS repeat-associated protein